LTDVRIGQPDPRTGSGAWSENLQTLTVIFKQNRGETARSANSDRQRVKIDLSARTNGSQTIALAENRTVGQRHGSSFAVTSG
jgi:hypothetical protein